MKKKMFILAVLFVSLFNSVFAKSYFDNWTFAEWTKSEFATKISYAHILKYDETNVLAIYETFTDVTSYIVCKDKEEAHDLALFIKMCQEIYSNRVTNNNMDNWFKFDEDYKAAEEWRLHSSCASLEKAFVFRLYHIIHTYGTAEDKILENANSVDYSKGYIEKRKALKNKVYYSGEVKELIDSIPKGNFLKLVDKFGIKPTYGIGLSNIAYGNKHEEKFIIDVFADW